MPSTEPPTTLPPPTTTTTIVPPEWPRPGAPPPFGLPSDVGLKFLADKKQAETDLALAQPRLAETQALRDKLQARWDRLTAELGRLDGETRTAIENLDDSRDRLQAAAVDAYMHNNSGGVDVALKTVMNAKTAVDMGRDIHLIDVYGDHEQDALHQFEAAKKQLDRQVGDLSDERSQVKSDLDQATQEVADLQAAVNDASVRIMASEHGIEAIPGCTRRRRRARFSDPAS